MRKKSSVKEKRGREREGVTIRGSEEKPAYREIKDKGGSCRKRVPPQKGNILKGGEPLAVKRRKTVFTREIGSRKDVEKKGLGGHKQ